MGMEITSLTIYPIKGCRGVAVPQVTLDRLGPVDDRRLMLVDETGRFLSQREIAAIATLVPRVDGPTLVVSAPGRTTLQLELDPDGPERLVSVWGKKGLVANDQGDVAARWFSDALGAPCRLVRFGSRTVNPVDPEYSPRPDAETSFTDGYPLLVVVSESLEALNRRLEHPVPMGRFRPSVVVSGAAAWSEDTWRELQIGELLLDLVKPCARCVVTTTDQSSGERSEDREPLRTLSALRHPGIFGQNAVPRGIGTLRVGDPVVVRTTRDRPAGLGVI